MINRENCTGCGACEQLCPENCIKLTQNNEGFFYPIVDNENCIKCGICLKKCPIEKKSIVDVDVFESYIGYNKVEEVRNKSSSGGIFSLLANEVLKDSGCVFGVSLNNELEAQFIKVDTIEDLHQLRGSKYVQSRMGDIFQDVRNSLANNQKVLFTGTACQIEGLKAYLGKDYELLLTADILCHGVPSPKVWNTYIKEKSAFFGKKIIDVDFRNKCTGWKDYSIKFYFSDGTSSYEYGRDNTYMKLFLSNICLRSSCYNCFFKNLNRISDISIGDSWGVENYMPNMDDDQGTSVILVHSQKGQVILNDIKENIRLEKVEVEKCLPATSDSRKSVSKPSKRDVFFNRLDDKCLEELVKLTEPSLYKKCKWKLKRKLSTFIR